MKLKCQKYSENLKEMTFFSDVLCLSRPCLEAIYTLGPVYIGSEIHNIQCVFSFEPVIKCVSRKGKNNYLTNTPKSENAVSI